MGSSVSVSAPYRVQQRCSFLSAFDAVSSRLPTWQSSGLQLRSEGKAGGGEERALDPLRPCLPPARRPLSCSPLPSRLFVALYCDCTSVCAS